MSKVRSYTDFGVRAKTKLIELGKEQKWLEEKVREDTNLFVDSGYLYKIFTGQRNAPKIISSISKILEIPVSKRK